MHSLKSINNFTSIFLEVVQPLYILTSSFITGVGMSGTLVPMGTGRYPSKSQDFRYRRVPTKFQFIRTPEKFY